MEELKSERTKRAQQRRIRKELELKNLKQNKKLNKNSSKNNNSKNKSKNKLNNKLNNKSKTNKPKEKPTTTPIVIPGLVKPLEHRYPTRLREKSINKYVETINNAGKIDITKDNTSSDNTSNLSQNNSLNINDRIKKLKNSLEIKNKNNRINKTKQITDKSKQSSRIKQKTTSNQDNIISNVKITGLGLNRTNNELNIKPIEINQNDLTIQPKILPLLEKTNDNNNNTSHNILPSINKSLINQPEIQLPPHQTSEEAKSPTLPPTFNHNTKEAINLKIQNNDLISQNINDKYENSKHNKIQKKQRNNNNNSKIRTYNKEDTPVITSKPLTKPRRKRKNSKNKNNNKNKNKNRKRPFSEFVNDQVTSESPTNDIEMKQLNNKNDNDDKDINDKDTDKP